MDVIIKKCDQYDFTLVKEKIYDIFKELNLFDKINSETKVFVKLNLVGAFDSSMGITTHPIVVQAVLDLLKQRTNNIIIGDNPATKDQIVTLKKCGIYNVIKEYDCKILEPTLFTKIHNSNPNMYSEFEVSKQMIDADVLINIPKLKTHTLAYMTVAEKNFFGLIYGLNKSAWHVKANNPLHFGNAINDLYGALLESYKDKTIVHLCDGIIGLEGEGPSAAGDPKKANVLLASYDAVALDRVACELVKLDQNKLYITNIAQERGYGEGNLENINIIGNQLNEFNDIKFKAPRDSISHVGLKILRFKVLRNLILEHPTIDKNKCIKCGECAKICPPKTMVIEKGNFPHLKNILCIRCWCCAEVCPKNAIQKSKRPILGKILLKTDKEK